MQLIFRVTAVITMVLVGTGSVNAQEVGERPAQGAFGPATQEFWVYASQFKGRASGIDLLYNAMGYWLPSGGGGAMAEAQVNLPAGAVVESFDCHVYDADPSLNISVTFMRNQSDMVTGVPAPNSLSVSADSTGSAGYGVISSPTLNYSMRFAEGTTRYIHTLLVQLPASMNVRFRACRILWHRSVSPAPGTATFADVPLGSPLHAFVEALVAAGITGGCGGGNYCPNSPLTRGQMAVFLAAALGLHWPN